MNDILEAAIEQKVNDIYLLPTEDQQYVIKFHLDGQAVTFKQISEINAQTMISALKYRAKMNISERRRPQLGRFKMMRFGYVYLLLVIF